MTQKPYEGPRYCGWLLAQDFSSAKHRKGVQMFNAFDAKDKKRAQVAQDKVWRERSEKHALAELAKASGPKATIVQSLGNTPIRYDISGANMVVVQDAIDGLMKQFHPMGYGTAVVKAPQFNEATRQVEARVTRYSTCD